MNYYNEIDDKAAAWLRELVSQKLIPAGDVDTRSITEVKAHELKGYTQCHFFAGIAGWPLALQLAGWPADRPVWTGSCPCQPFSTAGKGLAQKDERHLWPVFFDLIRQCRPPVVFGEQVASSAVVGPSNPPRHLQDVRGQQAMLRILQELKRREAGSMQGVRQSAGAAEKTVETLRDGARVQEMAGREERTRSRHCGKEPSEESRDTFQHRREGCADEDRRGGVRSDRDTFQPKSSASLECPVARPDGAKSGIHPGEHQGGSLRLECDGELLGVAENCGGVEGDTEHETRSIEQIIGKVGGFPSEEDVQCWLDGVSADLEAEGYACGATVLGAHSVQSPHQRQRLYWVADSEQQGLEGQPGHGYNGSQSRRLNQDATGSTAESGAVGGMANAGSERRQQISRSAPSDENPYGRARRDRGQPDSHNQPASDGKNDHGMADANGSGSLDGINGAEGWGAEAVAQHCSNIWSDFTLVHCRDGKTRRVPTEPAFFPLAHGVPARVVRLRGYGNAIVPQVAAEFVKAYLGIE